MQDSQAVPRYGPPYEKWAQHRLYHSFLLQLSFRLKMSAAEDILKTGVLESFLGKFCTWLPSWTPRCGV